MEKLLGLLTQSKFSIYHKGSINTRPSQFLSMKFLSMKFPSRVPSILSSHVNNKINDTAYYSLQYELYDPTKNHKFLFKPSMKIRGLNPLRSLYITHDCNIAIDITNMRCIQCARMYCFYGYGKHTEISVGKRHTAHALYFAEPEKVKGTGDYEGRMPITGSCLS